MAFTQVNCSGTWTDKDGTPERGSVTVKLPLDMTNSGVTVAAYTQIYQLDGIHGSVNFTLDATDDPGTTPQWLFYQFQVALDNKPIQYFDLIVSHTSTGYDLNTLAVVGAQYVSGAEIGGLGAAQ